MKFRRKIKRWLIIVALLLLAFAGYVEWANRNSPQMTYKQKILKAFYPAWMWWNKMTGKRRTTLAKENRIPPVSFYDLKAIRNAGDTLHFSSLKNKKVLIVNTASNCGFTGQYEQLQKLYDQYSDRLEILAFPANDFKEQEKGSDAEIAEFCRVNFGVRFPLMKKTTVVPGTAQHAVYRWLTDSTQNGWNERPPGWNFTKYLVDENGKLVNYFDPSISPLSEEVTQAIEKK
jgi:glutathione peroxidase